MQPFERLEATLHRDLTAELGLTSGRDVFINLQQHGAARGVRVTETSPGHIVVSGSLVELLASRVGGRNMHCGVNQFLESSHVSQLYFPFNGRLSSPPFFLCFFLTD